MVDVVGCKMCLHVLILFEFHIQAELNEVGKKNIFSLCSCSTKTEILMTFSHFIGILIRNLTKGLFVTFMHLQIRIVCEVTV